MRKKLPFDEITDEMSPDFSVCEHCGVPIGWDDYSYTHMTNGFATCGTKITGGQRPKGALKRLMRSVGVTGVVNPVITQDPNINTRAEPVEWFRETPQQKGTA